MSKEPLITKVKKTSFTIDSTQIFVVARSKLLLHHHSCFRYVESFASFKGRIVLPESFPFPLACFTLKGTSFVR